MPLYNSQVTSNSPLKAVYPGDTYAVFSAESPASGQASIAVHIASLFTRALRGLGVEIIFSGNPGTFNYRIQGTDTDSDPAYFTEGSGTVTTATGPQSDGTYRARVELAPWVAKFCRLLVNTQTSNAVTVTVNVTAL